MDNPNDGAAQPRPTIVLAEAFDEKPGVRIGHYKLLEQLGEGGCGVVYVAEQEEPVRRRVALKVIKLGMDTRQVIARFEAERQALALMDHPNIAKVLDAGTTETGRPFFVMELVKGVRITDYCDRNNLSTTERLSLFVQVCQAIQHAHQKGIIHRDIKPSNILVTLHDGVPVPKVIDFGIAKAIGGQHLTDKTLYTAVDQFVGTPAYMSPEQAELSGLDIDTRSDIYALGVMLYELLTGRTPFDAKRLIEAGLDEIRRIIREEEPPRPSTRISTLNAAEQTDLAKHRGAEPPKLLGFIRGDLDWIVMKTLEKDRSRRYETASGLAADIQRHLNNEPVVARPPSSVYRFQKLVRRNKLAVGAAAAVATVLVAGVIVSTWQAIRATRAEHEQRALREEAQASRQKAEAAEKKALTQAERAETAEKSALTQAERAEAAAREAKLTLAASDFLQAIRLIAEDKNHDALAYLARSLSANPTNSAALTRLATLLTHHWWMWPAFEMKHRAYVHSAQFSPDGTRIVTASYDNTAGIWDAQTGQALTVPLQHSSHVVSAQFSPDARWIVTASSDNTARVWDVGSGLPLTDPLKHSNALTSVQFSSDGRRVITASDKAVSVWDAQTGRLLTEPLKHDREMSSVVSSDGRRIVTFSSNKTVRVWNVQNGQVLTQFLSQDERVSSPRFSLDGKWLLTTSARSVRVWNAQTGKALIEALAHSNYLNSAEFSPSGTRIVTGSQDSTARVWDTQTGQPVTAPLKHARSVQSARFSPDGKRVITASDDCTARIWDALTGQPLTEPLKHNRHVHSAQFSPDGKKVVTVSEDNTARVWDAEIGQALNETLRHSDSIYLAQFSQDGKRVLTGSTDHSTRAWDAQTGKALTVSLKLDEQSLPWQFSPDGKRVVSASDKGARVWDALTGKALTESMEDNDLRTAEFSPDGKRLATTSANTARVWDALTGHALTAPLKHSEHVLSVQFSPDGKRVVTASLDKTAQVWDALTGQPLADPLKHGLMVRSAQFSPDGSRIATASWDRTARVWDARTSHALTDPMLHNDGVRSVQFGPDGKRIVTTSGNAARLWDAQTGQPLTQLLEHSGSVESAQFSPDGKWVVTASEDGTARVWDVLTGQALTEPLKHQQTVVSAQFNSDGTQLVTASDENKVRLWDIAPSATRCPDWLLMVAEAISGQVLNKNGVLEETKLDYQEALNRIRQELAQESAETGWGVWGRWFLADRATRTISPFSKITLPEYIEDRIRESTTESLDEAEHLALGDQNLQNRIGEAREARGRTDRAAELRRQADALAGRGKLSEAAADMAKAVELDPTDHWYWFVLAPLVVENGDVQGYHKLCQAMLARFGATNDPSIAERTAKVCLLLPVAVAELATASRLSELAVADGKDSPWLPYYQCTKGLSEYRQGRFTSAVDWVQKALASPGVIARDVQASMVLAMAQQQLNQPNEARATLAKGRELAETNLPKLDSGDLGPDWHDVLIANILMREAQGLIEGEKAAVKKSP